MKDNTTEVTLRANGGAIEIVRGYYCTGVNKAKDLARKYRQYITISGVDMPLLYKELDVTPNSEVQAQLEDIENYKKEYQRLAKENLMLHQAILHGCKPSEKLGTCTETPITYESGISEDDITLDVTLEGVNNRIYRAELELNRLNSKIDAAVCRLSKAIQEPMPIKSLHDIEPAINYLKDGIIVHDVIVPHNLEAQIDALKPTSNQDEGLKD